MSDTGGVRPIIGEKAEEIVDVLLMRRNAKRAFHYQAVFCGEGDRPSHHGEKVLADLARFCRGNETTFDTDPRVHALLEGRREVFLRILKMLEVDSREVRRFVEVKDE